MKTPRQVITTRTNMRLPEGLGISFDPFQKSVIEYLDTERERVDKILHEIVSVVPWEKGNEKHEKQIKHIHDMIDGLPGGKEL